MRASVSGAGVHVVQQRRQIRQHERVRVFRADEIAALLGEVGFLAFFVHREKQFLLLAVKIHFLLVLVQFQFRAVHQPAFSGILQNFHQALGLRLAGLDAEQQQADLMFQLGGVCDVRAVGRMQFFDQLLGLVQKAAAQLLLRADERFHESASIARIARRTCASTGR